MIGLFKVFIPVGTLTLLVSEIVLVTSAFVFATYLVLEVDPTVFLLYDGGLIRILLVLLSILVGCIFTICIRSITSNPESCWSSSSAS